MNSSIPGGIPTLAEFEDAAAVLRGQIATTPVLESQHLSDVVVIAALGLRNCSHYAVNKIEICSELQQNAASSQMASGGDPQQRWQAVARGFVHVATSL